MKLIKHWKTILIAFLILYGSITSGENLNKMHLLNIPYFDKFTHLIFYFILSIVFYSSLQKTVLFNKTEQIIITFFLVISYGIIMEVLQYYFTSTRKAEIFDVLVNTFGCIFGLLIIPFLNKFSLVKYL
jgi:VanZ family protein